MRATTLFEVRREETVAHVPGWFGLSARELGYLVGAILLGVLTFLLGHGLVGLIAPSLAALFGALFALSVSSLLIALGFASATALRYLRTGLPAPRLPAPTDPTLPPLRLDRWLLIVLRHRRRGRILLYRRGQW